jgi:hypothetical protein
MSSLPLNTASVQLLPAIFEARRSTLLQHIAKSAKFADVRPASHLEVRPRPEMLASGVAELDAITGGIPCGCMTVLYGPASSGKTSALLAALAKNTQDDGTCVLIDASDSFDPKSAAAAGVNFNRLLWVRCGEKPKGSSAIGRRRSAINSFAHDREPRATSGERRTESQEPRAGTSPFETRLDQVLKTTDLILQSGGFGLVVLDLAGIPEKFVRRIPLASWFRFQRAVEHTKTALLVVSEFACSQTCAALVLKIGKQLSAVSLQLSETPEVKEQRFRIVAEGLRKPAHAQVLSETRVEAELVRSRLERKPMQSVKARFATQAVRAG